MIKQYIDTDSLGDKFYFKDPEMTILHREDGPAFLTSSGSFQEWWVNGKLHRLDGPAIERPKDYNRWYVNGVFIFKTNKEGKVTGKITLY